ncbi:MAG: hypothetical protein ACI9MR_003382 [Myxococcota bacterium]|jgi:hypothetical protein
MTRCGDVGWRTVLVAVLIGAAGCDSDAGAGDGMGPPDAPEVTDIAAWDGATCTGARVLRERLGTARVPCRIGGPDPTQLAVESRGCRCHLSPLRGYETGAVGPELRVPWPPLDPRAHGCLAIVGTAEGFASAGCVRRLAVVSGSEDRGERPRMPKHPTRSSPLELVSTAPPGHRRRCAGSLAGGAQRSVLAQTGFTMPFELQDKRPAIPAAAVGPPPAAGARVQLRGLDHAS